MKKEAKWHLNGGDGRPCCRPGRDAHAAGKPVVVLWNAGQVTCKRCLRGTSDTLLAQCIAREEAR